MSESIIWNNHTRQTTEKNSSYLFLFFRMSPFLRILKHISLEMKVIHLVSSEYIYKRGIHRKPCNILAFFSSTFRVFFPFKLSTSTSTSRSKSSRVLGSTSEWKTRLGWRSKLGCELSQFLRGVRIPRLTRACCLVTIWQIEEMVCGKLDDWGLFFTSVWGLGLVFGCKYGMKWIKFQGFFQWWF